MIVRLQESFKVADLQINEDYSKVTCQINSKLRNYVQVGESITIDEDFDMNFGGCNSKWKIIFYPKGQYDFGVPSNDCRIYLKLISCEKAEVKMKITTYLISTASNQTLTVSSTSSCDHLFVTNNNLRNWAGPFSMQPLNDSIDSLSIKCTFRLVSNVKDSRRGLSEPKDNQLLNLNSSKKPRCVSPSVQGISKQICSPMEVDVALTPKPLAAESPQLFSPEGPYVDLRNPFISKQNAQSTRFKSSGCLKLSDIESVEETGQSGTKETSTSDSTATLSSDDESNYQATFEDKVRFYQDTFK